MINVDTLNTYIIEIVSSEIERQGKYISKLGKNICNYDTQIYSWLNGKTRMPAAALIYLAFELNISLDDLVAKIKEQKIGEV